MPSYLFGTVGVHALDVRGLCRGRVTAMELTATPGTVVSSALSLGIYTPHVLRVECEAAPVAPSAVGAR